jgi:hypothetical protein
MIRQAAQQHGVSEGLIKAVMHTESGFNINARSPVGAQGLMQLMPATARRFNVSNAYDPQQNIFGGARYLSWLLKRFNGNTQLALLLIMLVKAILINMVEYRHFVKHKIMSVVSQVVFKISIHQV